MTRTCAVLFDEKNQEILVASVMSSDIALSESASLGRRMKAAERVPCSLSGEIPKNWLKLAIGGPRTKIDS